MNRKFFVQSALCSAALIAASALTSCAPNLGQTIEAPEIPAVSTKSDARARLGSYITIADVVDTRPAPASEAAEKYTEPFGGVNTIVQNGLKSAFKDVGIAVTESAPVTMKVEVRKWRSQIDSKSSSKINSEATLFVELIDPSGKRIYSGTYNGERSSTFPVVTRVDVKDSLGIAMSNAIDQVISDPQFLEYLASF